MTRKGTSSRGVRSLAELISAVLRHPDTPAALYNDLVDHLSGHAVDLTTPEHVAGWLEHQRRAAAAATRAPRKGKR